MIRHLPAPAAIVPILCMLVLAAFCRSNAQPRAFKTAVTGDYASVPHATMLAPATITLECWISLDGTTGEQTILDKRDVVGGYSLRVAGGTYPLGIAFVLKQTTEEILWVGESLEAYTWYHVAATYDGSTARLYLNGRQIGFQPASLSIGATTSPLRISEYSGFPGGSFVFHGMIDDIRIWNGARSEVQIRSTMNSELAGTEPGLAGYWKCNDASSDSLRDATPNHNHADILGAGHCVPSTAPIGVQAVNSALRIGGAGAYAQAAHSPLLSPAYITVECWVRKDTSLDYEYTIVDKRGNGSGYNLRLAGTGFPLGVYWALDGSGTFSIIGAQGIFPHTWYHIAATYDGITSRLFINGELVASAAASLNISQSTSPFRIGEFLGYPGLSLRLRGAIDEVRVWVTARTQAQIRETMHRNLTGMEPGLAGYWRFNEGSGAIAYDGTLYEQNATLNPPALFSASEAPVGFIPPPAPVGFRPTGGDGRITLRWQAKDTAGVNRYVLYRSPAPNFDPTGAQVIDTVSYPVSSYEDTSPMNGQRYYYRLRAVDTSGHPSGSSPEIAGKASPILGNYFTGVYYYPWYSNSWGHTWPGQFVRDYLLPSHAPALGQYDSRSASVISQHLTWSRQYGIDLWVCSWWGQGSNEDVTIRNHILPALTPQDVRFTVFYESFMLGPPPWVIGPAQETQLVSDFLYIARTYFAHPNFYRVGGRPVVFLYISGLYQGNYAGAFAHVRQALADSGYGQLYLVGDEMGWSAPSDHMTFLDAVTAYAFFGTQGYGIEKDFFGPASAKFSEWEVGAHARGRQFIPVASPGFNNRKLGQTDPSNSMVIPRQSTPGAGSTSFLEDYVTMGRPFADSALQLIVITSWNEWHEDTQIEPTTLAPPTSHDTSFSGTAYTNGYEYEGYGTGILERVQQLLGGGLQQATRQIPVAGGWNLISVPLAVSDYTKNTLFPTSTSSAFAYQGGYVAQPVLANGKGYWLKFGASQNVGITGFARGLDSTSVVPGWNLIGSISEPIAVTSIGSVPPGLVTSGFFGYGTTGYAVSDSIRPGSAYWVKASAAGKLVLSTSSPTTAYRIHVVHDDELPPAPPEGGVDPGSEVPTEFALGQNFPNPFNPTTDIRFQITDYGRVRLVVYDLLGRQVATLVDEEKAPGSYTVTFPARGGTASGGDASNLSSGTYIYRLTAGGYTTTRRMMLVK